MIEIEYSRHARARVMQYGIAESCIAYCLANPALILPDRLPDRVRYYGCCPGQRYMYRVVVRNDRRNFVITIHPDHKFPCPQQ